MLYSRSFRNVWVFLVGLVLVPLADAQDFRGDVGYNKLANALGTALEDGSINSIAQIEANEGDPDIGEFFYLPNPDNTRFQGKTFIDGSGFNNGISAHSTSVGNNIYGNSISLSPGTGLIRGFEVNDYLNRVLGFAGNVDPLVHVDTVANHSWVFSNLDNAIAENVVQRLDFVINRDEISTVVGVNNGSGSVPKLMSHSYNSIAVGRSDGNHSHGTTTFYGAGRTKPDIVAPHGFTSQATGYVSSAASLLHHKAANMGGNAGKTEVIKAALMAGATKMEDDFTSTWDRTSTRPLDDVYGAGELNVYNSYFILDGGEQDGASTVPNEQIAERGWDYDESLAGGDSRFYEFEVMQFAEDVSVLLTWNMLVEDLDSSGNFDPSTQLADLTLTLFDSTSGFMASQVDISMSPVDNVEHIYLPTLGKGLYHLEVSNGSSFATDYALAWRMVNPIPEPSGLAVGLILLLGLSISRTRRRLE